MFLTCHESEVFARADVTSAKSLESVAGIVVSALEVVASVAPMRGVLRSSLTQGLRPGLHSFAPSELETEIWLIPDKRKVILRAQRVESILDLLINFRLFNSALQDDRSIRRNEMRQLPRLRLGFRPKTNSRSLHFADHRFATICFGRDDSVWVLTSLT